MNTTAMKIISRAMIAGACGGILAAVFAITIGEESINAAIAIEEAAVAVPGEVEADPLVSRGVQAYIGLPLAGILVGAFAGLAFGTVLSATRHRIAASDDFRRSVILAAAAFVSIALVPAIKYPANPPAVGDPDTVGQRSIYFFTLVLAGIVLSFGIGLFQRWAADRFDRSLAAALTATFGLASYTALLVAWPSSPDSVPVDFPAQLLWEFRLQSITTLALLFIGLGLGTGVLLTRPEKKVGATHVAN